MIHLHVSENYMIIINMKIPAIHEANIPPMKVYPSWCRELMKHQPSTVLELNILPGQ